jgi:hypothetical protein
MKIKTVSLLTTLLLAACAAPKDAPTFSTAPVATPRDGMAVLYIYREYAEPTAWKPTIYIDGTEVVSLPQQGFSWIYLSPGKHTVVSKWPFLAGAPKLEFTEEYKSEMRYFYEITGTSRMISRPKDAPDMPGTMYFRTTAQMKSYQESEAIDQLRRCCRFIPPATTAQ